MRVTIRKAVCAGLFTGAAALGMAMGDGGLTVAEAVASAGAALSAAAATYLVPYQVRARG